MGINVNGLLGDEGLVIADSSTSGEGGGNVVDQENEDDRSDDDSNNPSDTETRRSGANEFEVDIAIAAVILTIQRDFDLNGFFTNFIKIQVCVGSWARNFVLAK